MVNINAAVRRMWKQSRPLTFVCLLMLVILVLNVAGIYLDRRVITGAPAWLKPAKFAISTALFTGMLAWMMQFLTFHPRQARAAGRIIALFLAVEIAVIDLQAARGTTSHFNFRTPLDGFLFGVMGVSILIFWLASVWFCVLLFRQEFAIAPLGWALRLGMAITVLGALSGGLMTRPTPAQENAFAHKRPAVIGGHTVGAPDGGPGLPVVNWSANHGDLRIPHFLGLHGVQIVPLIYAFFIRRRYARGTQSKLVFTAAASYAAFALLLGWQALRGQSIAAPGTLSLEALALWVALSVAALMLAARIGGHRHSISSQAV